MPCPGVKHLDDLRSGINLIPQVGGNRRRKVIEQFVQELWLLEGHLFDDGIVLAAFPFHDIRRQRPRCANKAKDGGLIANAAAQAPKHLADKGHALLGLQRSQCFHLTEAPDWITNLRAFALNNVELDPHSREWSQDVRK